MATPTGAEPHTTTPRTPWLGLLAVGVATAIAYAPTLANGLTNWDDDAYVRNNPWLGQPAADAFVSMLGSFYKGNYHPLTMISLWLDHRISGGSIVAHHAVNGLLHLANTLLAGGVVLGLTRRRAVALAAAALFGLHPVHVESVAWVSERKDVLYAFFYLASLLVYVRAVQASAPGPRWRGLGLAFALFVASLLSKGVAVSLVPTLLAVDWLLGRSLRAPRVWLEKIPFLAVALVSGLVTLAAQGAVGQLSGESQWSLVERIALAGTAYCRYLGLLFVPVGLSAFHPYPARVGGALPAVYWLGPAGFLAVQALTLALVRRVPVVAFGLGFFTLNVALLLQLVPVGGALVAERYVYVAALGVFVAVAAAAVDLAERHPALLRPLGAAALVCLAMLGAGTWQRSLVWQDSLHLWDDTLARHPDVPVARLNRALARHEAGDLAGAIADLDAALDADPRYARALGHRGVMRFQAGDAEGALEDLDRALVTAPSLDLYLNRGAVRLAIGDATGALADLERVLQVDPGQPLAWANRGLAQAALGRHAAAISDFDRALALAPGYLPAWLGRGEARLALGDAERSLADADAILAAEPDLAEAHWLRGRALLAGGQTQAGCAAIAAAAEAGHGEAAAFADPRCAR